MARPDFTNNPALGEDYMGKAPAFQFYAADFLIGTFRFSAQAVGLYIRMLAFSWDIGPMPLDHDELARMAGMTRDEFDAVWPKVAEKWEETPAGYVNERLEQQRAERAAFAEKQAAKGRRSAENRAAVQPDGNHGSTAVQPDANQGAVGVPVQPEGNSSVFDLQSSEQEPRAREVTPRLQPIIDGRAQQKHGSCFLCCYPDRANLCVTPGIRDRLLGMVGGAAATRAERLHALCEQVKAGVGADDVITQAGVDFWESSIRRLLTPTVRSSMPSVPDAEETRRRYLQ